MEKKNSNLNCPPIEDIKIINSKSYEYKKDNICKMVIVSYLSNETIKFSVIDISEKCSFDSKYENIYSLNDLIEINEYFDQGKFKKNFQKVFDILIEKYFDKNLFEIKNDEKEILKLIICLNIDNENVKINLNLKQKNNHKDDLINQLIIQIKILSEKSFEFDNKITLLNDKLNEMEKRFDRIILNSSILKNINDIDKLYSFISNYKKINNIKLIYKATQDGDTFLNVANKINNKSNLVFLYLTKNGKIFGAFIKTKLENINEKNIDKYYKDENAFSFSFDNNKIYKILIPEYAIRISNKYIICIGNNGNWNGFYSEDNFLNQNYGVNDEGLIKTLKIYDFSINCELTNNKGWTKLNEVEIFEVEFN